MLWTSNRLDESEILWSVYVCQSICYEIIQVFVRGIRDSVMSRITPVMRYLEALVTPADVNRSASVVRQSALCPGLHVSLLPKPS